MKIYIEASVIAKERMSGIGHATFELISELDRHATSKNYQLTLIVPFGKRELIKSYGFKSATIRYYPPGYKVLNYLLTRTSLPLNVDIFYGKGVYLFPDYRNWRLRRSKSLTIVYDMAFVKFPETIQPKNLAYLQKNFKRWISRTTAILAISQTTKGDLLEVYSSGLPAVEVLLLGVNHELYQPQDPEAVDDVRKRYEIPEKYFLYVGNVEPRKNLDTLVEAYMLLPKKSQDSHSLVVIGGDGWNNSGVLQKIEEAKAAGLEIIRPELFVPDEALPAIYSGATALVHVPIYEGFGSTPLEAMSVGVPVICSDIAAIREVVGQAGLYCSPRDARGISDKMESVMIDESLRQKHIVAGMARAAEFSWQKSAMQLIEHAESLHKDMK